ncbi:MAG: type II secretion system protein [Chthoniobacterales bacterium]
MKKCGNAAFTLIELLVVVAIVAVLASLLIATLGKARSQARVAKSISNLRQIATAINLYVADNNDLFPRGYFYQPGESELTYVTELAPYLGHKTRSDDPSKNIFIAPTSAVPIPPQAPNSFIPLTYAVHGVLCPDTSTGRTRVRRSSVQRPAQVILVGDSSQNSNHGNSFTTFTSPRPFRFTGALENLDDLIPIGPDSDTPGGMGQLRYRSNNAAAVAMVDGHVALLPKGSVTYGNLIPDR